MTYSTPYIIAIANQKGGVGKTTTAVNLATAMAATGKKTLLIDLDPQGNASTGLGIQNRVITSYDLLVGRANVLQAVQPTKVPHLSLIPATVDLSGAEIELTQMDQMHYVLKNALQPVLSQYDYVFIDCPPSLGLLTLNALCLATRVMVPLQCEFFALEGLSHLLKTVRRVKQKLNPELDIQGSVLTMVDRRNKLSRQVEEDVRAFMGEQVYETVIPRNIRISEAPSHGLPALLYDFHSPGARAYVYLARELIRQNDRAEETNTASAAA
jgi:chromosome partitioning protein